jgi:hypothetical protein
MGAMILAAAPVVLGIRVFDSLKLFTCRSFLHLHRVGILRDTQSPFSTSYPSFHEIVAVTCHMSIPSARDFHRALYRPSVYDSNRVPWGCPFVRSLVSRGRRRNIMTITMASLDQNPRPRPLPLPRPPLPPRPGPPLTPPPRPLSVSLRALFLGFGASSMSSVSSGKPSGRMMYLISLPRMLIWSREMGSPPLGVILATRRLVFICGLTEAMVPRMVVPVARSASRVLG